MFNPVDFIQFINERIEDCENTLILGCGQGRHELELKGLKRIIGIDCCEQKLKEAETKGIETYLGDIRIISKEIDNDVETVTLFDIIEHFNKKEALELLVNAERIASKQVICFVPIQDKLDKDIETLQKLQENCIIENKDAGYHLSIWTEQEFKDLGYKTFYSPNFHGSFGALIAIKKL
jgi:ubiquinone/menaquinone biosynthesis C-methylase UbiE